MDFTRTGRRMHEINLTPLIDIVFHLMVFVMLTTTFVVSESMELSLPSAHSKSSGGAAAGVTLPIMVMADGSLLVSQARMNSDQLNQLLVSKLGANPDTKVVIYTTAGVTVQQLIGVMDMVYLTGGRNIQVDKAG